jgi:hypothetical protein
LPLRQKIQKSSICSCVGIVKCQPDPSWFSGVGQSRSRADDLEGAEDDAPAGTAHADGALCTSTCVNLTAETAVDVQRTNVDLVETPTSRGCIEQV